MRLRYGPVFQVLAARGVIVGYCSQEARGQAMKALVAGAAFNTPQAVPGERMKSATGRILTLATPDMEATIARLNAQPEVAYVVADALPSALDLDQPAH